MIHLNLTNVNCAVTCIFPLPQSIPQAHYHDNTFNTLPDGTPDLSAITIDENLGAIIKQLVNYAQGKRPNAETVATSTYFTEKIEEKEEEVAQEEEEKVEVKVEEDVKEDEAKEEVEAQDEIKESDETEVKKETEEVAQTLDDGMFLTNKLV